MPELLTVKEVAQELRVGDATIRHWLKLGILEGVLLPHRGEREIYRIKRETVNKVLEKE